MGRIIYDKDYIILEQKTLFTGGISFVPADENVILSEVLNTKKRLWFRYFP